MERARARMSERSNGAQWHKPLNKSSLQFFAEGHASHAAPRAAHPRDRLHSVHGRLAISCKAEADVADPWARMVGEACRGANRAGVVGPRAAAQ